MNDRQTDRCVSVFLLEASWKTSADDQAISATISSISTQIQEAFEDKTLVIFPAFWVEFDMNHSVSLRR